MDELRSRSSSRRSSGVRSRPWTPRQTPGAADELPEARFTNDRRDESTREPEEARAHGLADVAAYVEARNAEKWDPAVVQRDEDEDPTSMKDGMAKRA